MHGRSVQDGGWKRCRRFRDRRHGAARLLPLAAAAIFGSAAVHQLDCGHIVRPCEHHLVARQQDLVAFGVARGSAPRRDVRRCLDWRPRPIGAYAVHVQLPAVDALQDRRAPDLRAPRAVRRPNDGPGAEVQAAVVRWFIVATTDVPAARDGRGRDRRAVPQERHVVVALVELERLADVVPPRGEVHHDLICRWDQCPGSHSIVDCRERMQPADPQVVAPAAGAERRHHSQKQQVCQQQQVHLA